MSEERQRMWALDRNASTELFGPKANPQFSRGWHTAYATFEAAQLALHTGDVILAAILFRAARKRAARSIRRAFR